MAFFNKISGFLRHNDDFDIDSEKTQRVQMLSFSLLTVMFFCFIYSLAHIFFYELINGIFIFSVFVCISITYIYFRKTQKFNSVFASTIVLITILFIFLIFQGIGSNTSIIWGLCYPIIFAFLTDYKRSGILTLVFLALNIIIFITSNLFDSWADYSTDVILRYVSVYLLIFFFVQFFMRIRQQATSIKEKRIIDTQQKISEKNKFLSDLSYKIRTPLNNITGILNVQRDRLSEETVEEIELSLSNLISIINSIPEVFEKRLVPIKGKETFFDLNTTIKKSVKLFQSEKYSKLKMNLNLSNSITNKFFGDRLLLIQIIISSIDFLYKNIENSQLKIDISNKLKDSEEGAKISLKIKCSHGNKFLFGNDIVQFDELNDIIVIKDMVNNANAEIKIKKKEDFINFTFLFNYPSEEEVISQTDETKVKEKPDPFYNKKRKIELKDANILLVEDDIMNSKVLTLNLSKKVNKIIIAENGKEALEKYASTKIDLILMDIRMPLMDGFKTTEKIREAEIGTDYQTPIIAVTANASSEVKKRCMEVGMNDFTTKPINFKILIKKMEDLLT